MYWGEEGRKEGGASNSKMRQSRGKGTCVYSCLNDLYGCVQKELLMVLKFSLASSFLIKFIKTVASRGNGQKMPDLCRDTVANKPSGSPCFLLVSTFFIQIILS
jgi:hypothetical protein